MQTNKCTVYQAGFDGCVKPVSDSQSKCSLS